MGLNDLTNLTNAKSWCSPSAGTLVVNPATDLVFSRLISAVSQQVLDYCNRSTFRNILYNDIYNGTGTSVQFLRNWPVTSVVSLSIGGTTIQPSPQQVPQVNVAYPGYGFRSIAWDGTIPGQPSTLELTSGNFWTGHQNVLASYNAGYLIPHEAWTIPSPVTPLNQGLIQVNQPYGTWIGDNGVVKASGTAMAFVANQNPNAGQYSIQTGSSGAYLFNSADVGTNILISYSFVPFSVEQTVLDLINDTNSRKGRPGVRSKSLAGQETVSYDNSGLPAYAVSQLASYRNVIPV